MAVLQNGIVLIGSTLVDELVPPIAPGQLTYRDAAEFVSNDELQGENVEYSVGGMALNVAVDLAKMQGGYPIQVMGKVGKDHRAELVFDTLKNHNIQTDLIIVEPSYPTSFTEVMHILLPDGEVERIFRHSLGAMGTLCEKDIQIELLKPFKIAMFGYGLLLPQLDLQDDEYGTHLGRVLAQVQKSGIKTALDFVSPNQENMFKFERYKKSIQYVDYLSINEDQACSLTGHQHPEKACISLVEDLKASTAVVHCGAAGPNYAYSMTDGLYIQPNFKVHADEYKGNAGAGDAFCAGFLHCMHQEWNLQKTLKFATAAAAISLAEISCTGAMQSEKYVLEYMEKKQTNV